MNNNIGIKVVRFCLGMTLCAALLGLGDISNVAEAASKKKTSKRSAAVKIPDNKKNKELRKVCTSAIKLPNGAYIYKNSAPTRTGGVGTPLTGYRINPTLIFNSRAQRGSSSIYDIKGKRIGWCPWASAHGHTGGRARCVMNTRDLRRQAIKNTKSPAIYFKQDTKKCVLIPDAGRCYGSVKGLCNRLIY